MFGSFRTILAMFVLIGHLHGPFELGTYAVFGFYVLSGYLMTFIMHETYHYDLGGRMKFLLNRFLRIFPPYWFAACLSIILLLIFGSRITDFKSAIFLPGNIAEWSRNVFLVFHFESMPRLSPATWALTVELFYYLAICVGISKNSKWTIIWFLGSVCYTLFLLWSGADWSQRYFTIPAASLPFSLGALIFHFKDQVHEIPKINTNGFSFFLFLMICVNFCLSYIVEKFIFSSYIFGVGFYVNLALMSLLIVSLLGAKPNGRLKVIDSFLAGC